MGNVESVGCCGPDHSSARLSRLAQGPGHKLSADEEESPFMKRRLSGANFGERMKPTPDATRGGRRGMPSPVSISSREPIIHQGVTASRFRDEHITSPGSNFSARLIPVDETIPPNGPSTPNSEVAIISRCGRTLGQRWNLEDKGRALQGGATSPYTQVGPEPTRGLSYSNQRLQSYPVGGSAGFPDYIEDGLKPKLVPAHTALTPRRLAWGQSLLECRAPQLQTISMEVL